MPPDDPIITPTDVVKAGFCGLGLRSWLQAHGVDVGRFFRGEVHASEILAVGDENGRLVVERKQQREASE